MDAVLAASEPSGGAKGLLLRLRAAEEQFKPTGSDQIPISSAAMTAFRMAALHLESAPDTCSAGCVATAVAALRSELARREGALAAAGVTP
ncbi:MAG: hypothetical protein SFV54_16450 [Bryobacteraceae bacterium]|nr:hypothetical protein [Bryobacteraceae bacterium]